MKRAVLFAVMLLIGCSGSTAPSPFKTDAASADAGEAGLNTADSGPEGSTLGGPCLDDSQCDDGIACTVDRCDKTIGRCRSTPDDSVCDDGVYCDGHEICDPKLGCIAGVPISCSDGDSCTIDTCVEATHSCKHTLRDDDGDGDPPWNCGGGDCNDHNPLVSSKSPEICNNGIDDNCNGKTDEKPCVSPQYDTCVDALEIKASGNYSMPLAAATSNYSASCAGSGSSWRDVVAAIEVPAGPAMDVDITATTPSGDIALASATKCGDPSSEIGCAKSLAEPAGGTIARLRLYGLSSGNYPLYVFGDGQNDVQLSVDFLPATPKPTNETCGTAAELVPGTHVQVPIIDATEDVPSACDGSLGELVYHFSLAAPRDVHIYASSLDGYGAPAVSLRSAACSAAADELTCRKGDPTVDLYQRALPAGDYYVTVSADAPTVADLLLEESPPTTPPADETCSNPPALTPGKTIDVPLVAHTDDIQLGCLTGAPDAAYSLDLAQTSDVLLVERISKGDTGGVGLDQLPCGPDNVLSCGTSTTSPNRAVARAVPPGSYRAVVETLSSTPAQLTAFVRPTTPPVFVAFADTCADAVEIPPTGGRFEGTTANANADYDAGCDLGAQPPGGAPDQMLHLALSKQKRVVFDMKGSSYNTLLDVRRGPSCPGQEVANGCAAGYVTDRSYLDLTLDPGDYYVQIDGYAGDSGAWKLDVFVSDP